MKTKIIAALSAALALTMTACGTIYPPAQMQTETTTVTTAVSVQSTAAPLGAVPQTDDSQMETDAFIAEFFNSQISFIDVSEQVSESMKNTSFKAEKTVENNTVKLALTGKNGRGVINEMCIDLSECSNDYDMEYVVEMLGDYYFDSTLSQMSGITDNDFSSKNRLTGSTGSKRKYQRYGFVQKTDGMASQFGYTETYAVLNENKLTVVSGTFLSSDMMERQSFSQLMAKFGENVKY